MNKKHFLYKLTYAFITIASILFMTSCKKDSQTTGSNDPSKLIFSVAGVEDPITVNTKLGSINGNVNTANNIASITTIPLGNSKDIFLEVSSEKGKMESILADNSSGDIKSKINTKLAATSPLETNKSYKIFIYETGGGAYVTSAIAKAGTPTEIWVDETKTYDWYAVSYNEVDQQPLTLITEANFQVQTPIQKDLLYASGTGISTAQQKEPIGINFVHKVAVVSLKVDASLLGASLQSVVAKFNRADYFNTATLNLRTGTIGATTTQNIEDVIFTPDGSQNTMSANYYTANPANLTALTVSFEQINVQKTDLSIVNMVTERTPGASSIPVSYAFAAPVIGDRLSGSLQMISALPKMNIMHVSQFANSAKYLDNDRLGIPWDKITVLNIDGNNENGSSVGSWRGLSGFLRHNFAVVVPTGNTVPPKYVKYYSGAGTIPVKEGFTSEIVRPNEIANNLAIYTPDIIIMAVEEGKLQAADNTALINYVEAGGVVIMMMGTNQTESPYGGSVNYTDQTNYNSALPFLQHFFGSGATLHPTRFPLNASAAFKINSTINDPITNNFYGDMRNRYWGTYQKNYSSYIGGGQKQGEAVLVSGIDRSKMIEYSAGPPANIAYYVTSGSPNPPAGASIMFRHKDKNIFYIGDAGFSSLVSLLGGTTYYQSNSLPYSTTRGTDINGSPTTKPASYTSGSYTFYNSAIMGNVLLWAFQRAAYGQ